MEGFKPKVSENLFKNVKAQYKEVKNERIDLEAQQLALEGKAAGYAKKVVGVGLTFCAA